jgi:hypothetical protein
MTYLAIGEAVVIVILLALVCLAAWQTRQITRDLLAERRVGDHFARDLLDRQSQERAEWQTERQLLLNRIQAPELATGQAAAMAIPEPRKAHVSFDDDEDFWAAQEEMSDGSE